MMQTGLRVVVGFTLLAVFASQAAAQNERRFGLLFAYPGAIGVQWDASEKFALRVDADFARFQTTFGQDTSTSSYGSLGLSTLFIVHAANPLKLYVAPRVALTMNRNSSGVIAYISLSPADVPVEPNPVAPSDESETTYGFDVGARFGASYRLGDRFSVFGETGFVYERHSSGSRFGVTSSSIGARAGVGGMLYF